MLPSRRVPDIYIISHVPYCAFCFLKWSSIFIDFLSTPTIILTAWGKGYYFVHYLIPVTWKSAGDLGVQYSIYCLDEWHSVLESTVRGRDFTGRWGGLAWMLAVQLYLREIVQYEGDSCHSVFVSTVGKLDQIVHKRSTGLVQSFGVTGDWLP